MSERQPHSRLWLGAILGAVLGASAVCIGGRGEKIITSVASTKNNRVTPVETADPIGEEAKRDTARHNSQPSRVIAKEPAPTDGCQVIPSVSARARVLLDNPGIDGERSSKQLTIDNGIPSFSVDSGAGWISVEGYAPAWIRWWTEEAKFQCDPATLRLRPEERWVVGVVHHARLKESDRTEVQGCGGVAEVDKRGRFLLPVGQIPCEVQAWRRDGWFPATSEPVTVAPEPGEEVEVELWLAPVRRGGLGVAIVEDEQGLMLSRVFSDTPAASAGLQDGDRVRTVDGASTKGMGIDEFRELATGDDGTEVELEIEREGRRFKVVATRKFIDPGS